MEAKKTIFMESESPTLETKMFQILVHALSNYQMCDSKVKHIYFVFNCFVIIVLILFMVVLSRI